MYCTLETIKNTKYSFKSILNTITSTSGEKYLYYKINYPCI